MFSDKIIQISVVQSSTKALTIVIYQYNLPTIIFNRGKDMSDDSRNFYERYFVEQDFSSEEKLKQFERVEFIKRFARSAKIGPYGLAVGIGKGADLEVADKTSDVNIVALDLPFTYLPVVQKNFPNALVLQGDGTRLPFGDNIFDYIICSEVLEHVPDRKGIISEFSRVLKPDGILILTTPNWICLYGIARFLIELFSRRAVHAGDQPLDNWVTPWSIKREFAPYFRIKIMRGWWYFPPIGRGKFQLFPGFFTALWKLLMPLERLYQKIFPWFGHSVCIAANPRKPTQIPDGN